MVVDTVDEERVDRLFHALSDATRRDIVRRAMSGDQSVSALARNYPMSFAALRVDIVEESEGNVRMTINVRFPSVEAMEQMMAMGMDEGLALALGQIDDILLAGSAA